MAQEQKTKAAAKAELEAAQAERKTELDALGELDQLEAMQTVQGMWVELNDLDQVAASDQKREVKTLIDAIVADQREALEAQAEKIVAKKSETARAEIMERVEAVENGENILNLFAKQAETLKEKKRSGGKGGSRGGAKVTAPDGTEFDKANGSKKVELKVVGGKLHTRSETVCRDATIPAGEGISFTNITTALGRSDSPAVTQEIHDYLANLDSDDS